MSSKGKRGARKAKVKQQQPAEPSGDPNESLAAEFEMVGLDVLSWMNDTVNFETTGWSRSAPTQQLIREQNKQLRLVIPPDDSQHGRDAQTVDGLQQRRQAAIKIRNEQLLEPAHGKQFHNAGHKYSDHYPAGDPDGLTADGIFKQMAKRGIDHHFGKITKYTNTMIRVFSDALGAPIDQFDIKDVCEISNSVVSAVSKSVGSAMSKGSASSRPERSYRLDPQIPASWDAHPVQSGKFLAYQFPQSIDDVANGMPLERCRPEIASVQVAAHPFSRGAERIAYYGRDLRTNEDIVLKEYRHVTGGLEAGLRHEFANQLQTIATFFAAHYMAACEQKVPAVKIPARLDFLMTKTLALGPMDDLRYVCVEPRLDPAVRYLRFTNNHDFVLPEACAVPNGISD
ncbi:Efk-1 [Aphelenchoides fujianensis]|nr:Efk-1 [Aphelenchoides fujianensis]